MTQAPSLSHPDQVPVNPDLDFVAQSNEALRHAALTLGPIALRERGTTDDPVQDHWDHFANEDRREGGSFGTRGYKADERTRLERLDINNRPR